MATMRNLTLWVKCPKVLSKYQSIKHCFKCEYCAGSIDDELMCIYEEK